MAGDLARSQELYESGRRLMDERQFERAIEFFRESCSLGPHFKTLELEGECLVMIGKSREAIVPLAAAATLNSGVRAISLLADVYLTLGEFERSKHFALEALKRDSKNKLALQILNTVAAD